MESNIKLGLKHNWKQFALLVLINGFVGGMMGLERSIFPQFALSKFNISSNTALLSFIAAFGLSKAIANYFTGKLANLIGRKNILLYGWLIAVPIPWLLLGASSWAWVVVANVLLGFSQGMTWSSTVVMKIDLVGEKERGFAMGLNEFAGYLSVGLFAFLSSFLAQHFGIVPYPFYLGIALSMIGLMLTVIWVKDTKPFVIQEINNNKTPLLKNVFKDTSFHHKTLSSVTQAGLINNLNDGMMWGLLPILLSSYQFNQISIGFVVSIYPIVWGLGQLFTGKMADKYSKKEMLFWGMMLQGISIVLFPFSNSKVILSLLSITLGIGTALVYPTFLATIANETHPNQRAESIGTFRWWRDLGYVFGAILSGIIADNFGIPLAIYTIGLLTVFSALVIKKRIPKSQIQTKESIGNKELKVLLESQMNIQIIDVRNLE